MLKYLFFYLLTFLPSIIACQQFFDVDQSVKMTATVSSDPSVITVNWQQDPRTIGYDLYRRKYQ
ncbi:MAG: hypothetical protein AB8H12_16305, partial [Lewinella sp.]